MAPSIRLLNVLRGPGNTAPVIRAAASLLAFLALTGCGAPPRTPGPPGETLILLENRVDGPCELTWADARVDSRPVDRVTITPAGAKPAPLDRPILSAGAHTVSISASASCPGKPGDAQPAVLQVTRPVYMKEAGGQITISLTKDPSSDSGLQASFTVAGGHVLAPRADGGEVDCRGRIPVDLAICRTEGALARARKQRDVVLVTCISEKLQEMRLVARTASPPVAAGAPEDAALADSGLESARRVLALAREADHCIGEESFAGDSMSTERTGNRTVPAFR